MSPRKRSTTKEKDWLADAKKPRFFLVRLKGETFRQWVFRNLEYSLGGQIIDFIQISLSLVLAGMYGYINWDASVDTSPYWMSKFELVTGAIFSLEYLIRLYASDDRIRYIFSFFPIVDILTVLPTWIQLILEHSSTDGSLSSINFSPIRVLKALRILRAYRLLGFAKSMVQRQLFITLLTIISIIVCTAGIIQAVEACTNGEICSEISCRCQTISFFDSIYFVVVTITTLGYGDISPKGTMGRIVTATMILLTFVIVPIQVNRLVDILNRHSEHISSYKDLGKHPHAFVTGNVRSSAMATFLREFFHEDNPNWNEKVVILQPSEPSAEMMRLIHQYEPRIQYIVGSAMIVEDLERSKVSQAVVCYVFVDKFTLDADRADQASNLLTRSIRRFNPSVPLFSQVIKSENMAHIFLAGATEVICVERIKMSILARSCYVLGLSTLISNMLYTSSSSSINKASTSWQLQYLAGCSNELYPVELPPVFFQLTWKGVCRVLMLAFNAVPIAVINDTGAELFGEADSNSNVNANQPDTVSGCIIYIMCEGLSVVHEISSCTLEQIDETLDYLKDIHFHESNSQSRDVGRSNLHNAKGHIISPHAKKKKPMTIGSKTKTAPSSNTGGDTECLRLYKSSDTVYSQTLSTAKYFLIATSVDQSFSKREYKRFLTGSIPDGIKDHVVVCGLPIDLFDFVAALRMKLLKKIRPIILISSKPMTEHQYERISIFPEIYFVLGSCLSASDLIRASINSANSIVILTQVGSRIYEDENMVDADAITTIRYILEVCHRQHYQPNMIVDLVRPTNIKFMSLIGNGQGGSIRSYNSKGKQSPRHFPLAGDSLDGDRISDALKLTVLRNYDGNENRIISNSSSSTRRDALNKDTVTSTSSAPTRFWNPFRKSRIHSISQVLGLGNGDSNRKNGQDREENQDYILQHSFASGRVYLSNMLDCLLSDSYRKHNIVRVINLLVGTRSDSDKTRKLFQINVPSKMAGETYFECSMYLLNDWDLIAMGLWRERKMQHPPYVYTNPDHSLPLRISDKIFVIGNSEQEEVLRNHYMEDASKLRNHHERNSHPTISKKTHETSPSSQTWDAST